MQLELFDVAPDHGTFKVHWRDYQTGTYRAMEADRQSANFDHAFAISMVQEAIVDAGEPYDGAVLVYLPGGKGTANQPTNERTKQ